MPGLPGGYQMWRASERAVALLLCLTAGICQIRAGRAEQPTVTAAVRPELVLLNPPVSEVTSVAISPDGRMLAIGSAFGAVDWWEGAAAELRTLTRPTGRARHRLDWLRPIPTWLRDTLREHGAYLTPVAFSPDGRRLASGGEPEVRLWDTLTGRLERTLTGQSAAFPSVAFSPDGRTVAGGGADGAVQGWEAQTGETRWILNRFTRPQDWPVWQLEFSPDGGTLGTVSWDQTLRLWDVASGQLQRWLTGDRSYPWALAFSPDGRRLAVGSHYPRVERLEEYSYIDGYTSGVGLWDAHSLKHHRNLAGPDGLMTAVAFSPDSRLLAGGGYREVRLWDAQTGALKRRLGGHQSQVWSVAFFPSGRKLASASRDGTLKVWDVEAGRLLLTLTLLRPTSSPESAADWIAFTPEGIYHASEGARPFIRWRVGRDLLPVEAYEASFHQPERVRAALQDSP